MTVIYDVMAVSDFLMATRPFQYEKRKSKLKVTCGHQIPARVSTLGPVIGVFYPLLGHHSTIDESRD